MKVGDIITVQPYTYNAEEKQGIIIRQLPDLEVGLQVFEIMTDDGIIETYTSAAIKTVKRT